MRSTSVLFIILLTFLNVAALAQENGFNYRRKVTVPQEGWATLKLPPDIFLHCDDNFSDLRLYSIQATDTIEIPYLLKKRITRKNERKLEMSAINKSVKGNVLFVTFEMKGQKVNRIYLKFEEKDYMAQVRIEGSDDRKQWFQIADKQPLIYYLPSANPMYVDINEVSFPTSKYNYLRVSVDSNKPLTFSEGSFLHSEIDSGKFEQIPLRWKTTNLKKEQQTVAEIRLDHHRPVSHLTVKVTPPSDYYYRYYQIEALTDSTKTDKGWIRNYRQIGSGYLTSFAPGNVDLLDQEASLLRMTIHNEDNAPLRVERITADGHMVELIADLKPGNNFLFYGNAALHSPSYELAHFEEKIPATTSVAQLEQEENIGKPAQEQNALFENKVWLWAIMIVVIGLLGFFTLKMMRTKPEAAA